MPRKRPAEMLISHVSDEQIKAYNDLRLRTEKRESGIYGSLVRSFADLAEVTSPQHAIEAYKNAIVVSSDPNNIVASTIEMHLESSLRHFLMTQRPGVKSPASENELKLAIDHMKWATQHVDLRNSFPPHVTDAYARRKYGNAEPRHHLIWGASQMGKSEETFAREAMNLMPERREEVYEALTTGRRGALSHAIGATPAQLARRHIYN